MTALTVKFNLSLVLFIIATVLFLVAAAKAARPWVLPIGLACFSGAFLAERLNV